MEFTQGDIWIPTLIWTPTDRRHLIDWMSLSDMTPTPILTQTQNTTIVLVRELVLHKDILPVIWE
jgi:sucrose-6-phosphate hydrolase SacC (GH32 family)